MPTGFSVKLFEFAPVEGRRVVAAFDGGAITSDAGAMLLGQTDRAIGLTERFAACFIDTRRAELVEHKVRTLVMQRVIGIALGGACPRAGGAGPWGGPERPRRTAARPGAGGDGGQAGSATGALRGAGRQINPEPAGTEPERADPLSQDRT
jgi:hypothetical protein